MDRGRAAAALLALAACFTFSAAAPTTNQTALDSYEKQTEGCYYNFQHYGEGDRIMTNEPCLNCTCHNRMLMCYLRVCPFTKAIGQDCTVEKRADQCCPIVTCPDVPVDLLTSTSTTSPSEYGGTGVGKVDNYGCTINGKYFPEGSKVPPTPNKPCEHCYCIRNMTTCVMQECTLHVDGCTPIYHKDVCCPIRYFCDHAEDEIPLLDDMTTTIRPTPGFLLTTTTEEPTTEVAVKKECLDHDHLYTDGALIPSDKPCVHCYCMKGDIVCVVQECGAPMENEGKNCTSLPPREGHCCPDTYICEGDEISTERMTESISDDFTTLEPPRRVNIEGSGYRVEPETTHIPETLLEIEGSGDESTTIKSSKTSEVYPTLQPLEDELDNKYSPIETDLEHHPMTTETSMSENSNDITTEPDRGLNTIEYEATESSNYDKTTPKQYIAEQPYKGKTTIAAETKTTSFPYEEGKTTISIDGSYEPSDSHTTTHIDQSIDHGITTQSSIDGHKESSTSSSYLETTKTTVPDDQNMIDEGSGQVSPEPEIYNEATTQISDESGPDKSDESITTPTIDIDITNVPHKTFDDSTEHSIDAHTLTTENILSLAESTEKNIENLTTLMHTTESEMPSSTQPGQIDENYTNIQETTMKDDISSLEHSTLKEMDKLTTLLPELIHSTESEILSSTQTGQIYEKDITTQETTKKDDTLSLEESTEKVVENLTTLLPELIHSTESEMSASTQTELIDENAMTTHVTSEKDEMLSLEKSTEKAIDKLTTLLPELIHSTDSDFSISSQSGLDVISTTTTTDKQKLPEITPVNTIDNEIVEEVIPPGRIPGEGDCLQNGITYLNESSVPSDHKCQTRCKCISSIIRCDPIICMPQPENMGKCHRIYDSPDSCCPTYVCDHSKDTTPPESHSQMSGTESSILPSSDCKGDNCEMHEDKSPTTTNIPDYERPIQPLECSDGKCQIHVPKPPIEDQSHARPVDQDLPLKPQDCIDGKCQLPSTENEYPITPANPEILPPQEDCSDGKCTLPSAEDESYTTPASSDLLPTQQDCSGGNCDLPSVIISTPDCSDGKCNLPAIEDEPKTTPAVPDIVPSQEDCSGGKCDLPSVDVSVLDCSDGKCTLPPTEDEYHTTPATPDILPSQEDCSGGKCDLPSIIDVSPSDCSDGKCSLPPTEDEFNTTPASPDILPPQKDCSGGKCDIPSADVSPPDCSDGQCTLSPTEDEPHTIPGSPDILPPQKDCSDGKCDLPAVDVSPPNCSDGKCTLPPTEDEFNTTPASPDILPPQKDCSGGKCDLPAVDVSPPDCSDGKCTLPPTEDEFNTTPASPDILPPQKDCSGGKCDLPAVDVSPPDCSDGKCTLPPIEDEFNSTPASPDILPPQKDCSGGKCDLPAVDVSPPDCSDGKCTLPPTEDEFNTTPASPDILPPQKDCSGGKCDLPAVDVSPPDCNDGKCTLPPTEDEFNTTPASPDILPPQKDCSGGKCDLPAVDVSPPDCSDGKCTSPTTEDVSQTTPSTPDISPSQEDCSGGKCDVPSIDVSPSHCSDGKCVLPPVDDKSDTTQSNTDILPPQEVCSGAKCDLPSDDVSPPECSDGKCTLPPTEDESHTTPATSDISPPQEDCSGGKCDVPAIEVSPPDCSDGKCTLPPIEVESHTTPATSDNLPSQEDCSGGKCDVPSIDVSPPGCSDGKCTLPPTEDELHTAPASSDILPPQKDCSGGKCDLPAVDVSVLDCSDGKCTLPPTEDEFNTTPASPDILPPQKDCSGGKCDLPAVDVSPPDCSDGKCTLPPTEDEFNTTPASPDILPPQKDCSGGKCDLPAVDVSPPDCSDGKCTLPPTEDEFNTTPASSDILPPQKDCSGGKCDLPAVDVSPPDCSDGKCTLPPTEDEFNTTPASPDILPPQKDCSGGKCDLPAVDVSPPDCSDGKCTLPPTEDEFNTTPASPDILPPQKDCSGGKCDLPTIVVSPPDCNGGKCILPPTEDEYHTNPTTPDISPSQEDCSGGICDLPSIDVSPSDCSDGKCTLPSAEDESYTTPATPDILPSQEDCSGGKCDLPSIDLSHPDCSDGKCTLPPAEDESHTTPAISDCSDGKCDLPSVQDEYQTTPASSDILPPHEDCSDGKCDLPSIDVSPSDCSNGKCTLPPTENEPHTTPGSSDILPPQQDVSDKIPSIIPTEISEEPCEGEHCAEANEVCTDGSCISQSGHPGQEQTCTGDNCRRTEISETGVPVSCKGPECMPSTEIPIYPSYVTQGPIELPVSTEIVDHNIQTESPQSLTTKIENVVTGEMDQSETEKPFKSSDLPETDKDVFTTNVIEEPTTQFIDTVKKYSTDTGITTPSLLTEATTSKTNLNYEPVTHSIDDVEASEKLPKSTSAVETEISTKSSLDNIEHATASDKTTSLLSHDNDVIVSEQSTPIDIPETEAPIIEITTEQKPVENASEEQIITETPDIMTTKELDETKITKKPDIDVSPTKTTKEEEQDISQHTTLLPEIIETESPLSQFTSAQDNFATSTQGSIQDVKSSTTQDITTVSTPTESVHSKDDVTTELGISESQTKSPDSIYSTRLPDELKPQTNASPVLYEADTESTPIAEVPVQTEKITEPSIISESEETTTPSTIDIAKQPENLATEQPNIGDLTETTPYLVELEEHPHKTDDVSSSPSPAEQTTTYQQEQETQTTDSSSDRIPVTESHTESMAAETTSEKLLTTTVPSEFTESDNRSGPVTTLTPTQLLDEQNQTTQATIKPLYSGESTENNANITSQTTISTTTSKSENDITTQSSELDNKFGDEKLSTTTSATGTSKPTFDELLPTDDSLPSDDSQFPPSGGYGQETDYSDEDQAFGPGTCRYGGKVYVSAQQIPRDDPCDFCFCFRSDIICLQQSCPPPIHGCHEEPIQGFCCPRYECPVAMATALNLTTTTTTTTTTLPPHFLPHAYKGAAQRKGCQIKGHTYKVGEVVRASSGPCLHCTCGGDGQMKCDPKVCTPEPMLRQMIAAAVSAKRRR